MAEYEVPVVDVPTLTVLLDGRHASVRNLVRRNLVEHAGILEDAVRLPRAEFRERVLQVVQQMAATGQTGLGFPAEYGGGGDLAASVAAFETMAFGDLSVLVKVGVQFGLFGGAILQLGTRRHHERYLAEVVSGRLLGCFAMTESGHGSNVQAIGTTATHDPATGEFVITTPEESARKEYIGNAAVHGRMAVVFAQLEIGGDIQGVHAFLVPLRDEEGRELRGIRTQDDGPKIGLNGVDNGRIWFDHVRIPRENLLNRYADVSADGAYRSPIDNPNRRFFTMLGTLVQGRVSVAGAAVNAAKVALDVAVRYAGLRRQFGETGSGPEGLLLDHGLHQRRLFPLLAGVYAHHFAQEALVDEFDDVFAAAVADPFPDAVDGLRDGTHRDRGPEGADRRRRSLEVEAAGLKAMSTWLAARTIQECREACGGAGFITENRFDALRSDTDVFTTFEGDNHILLQLVAKGLLTDYTSEFNDLDQFGMVAFVAGVAVETVVERTGAHKLLERLKDAWPRGEEGAGGTWDQDAGLLDSDYHLAMLRWREEHLVAGVAHRLKRGLDDGMDAAEVFSRVQPHVISVGSAHAERVVLESFVEKVRTLPEGGNAVALHLLCDLYALGVIEQDRGWFMEHGRLSAQRAKAITRQIDDLLRRIRPLAVDLVAAFGVPPEMAAAAMIERGGY